MKKGCGLLAGNPFFIFDFRIKKIHACRHPLRLFGFYKIERKRRIVITQFTELLVKQANSLDLSRTQLITDVLGEIVFQKLRGEGTSLLKPAFQVGEGVLRTGLQLPKKGCGKCFMRGDPEGKDEGKSRPLLPCMTQIQRGMGLLEGLVPDQELTLSLIIFFTLKTD